jgi:hypothetical protein
MEVIERLGAEVEREWRSLNYDEAVFPALAAEALRRDNVFETASPWEAVKWALTLDELPRQKDVGARFGDPPVTLFTSSRFHIDLYFWFDGTTSVHQHGFCGAFQVVLGSSIHSVYQFEKRHAVSSFLEIGDIKLDRVELFELGAIQEITPGRGYIHSLFHLDKPSASLVVRTDRSPLELPQYSYHKPSVAIDPFFFDETLTKRLQLVTALLRARHPDAEAVVTDLLAASDLHTAYEVLRLLRGNLRSGHIDQLFGLEGGNQLYERLFGAARRRHGELVESFAAVFAHLEQENQIVLRRSLVANPEHRFFLALLMNVSGRQRILALVKQRFPDVEPLEKVLDWLLELAETRIVGSGVNTALGIEGFDDTDLFLVERMLEGDEDDVIGERIKAEYQGAKQAKMLNEMDERLGKLRNAVILRPLLAEDEVASGNAVE